MIQLFVTVVRCLVLNVLTTNSYTKLRVSSYFLLFILAYLQVGVGIMKIFFLFLHKNLCYGYSLEAPQWGTSNEYPEHRFSWRNKKKISIFGCKKSALSGAHSTDKVRGQVFVRVFIVINIWQSDDSGKNKFEIVAFPESVSLHHS